MPPRGRQEPDPEPDLEELLGEMDDDEIAELLERRKSGKATSAKGDRVTILEGKHAADWLKSFGVGGDDSDDGEKKPRKGFFDKR